MHVQQKIQINKSASKIFTYLNDVSNRRAYIPALKKIVLLDPLPLKEGSRYTEISDIAGRRMETTYQITEFIQNKQISAKTIKSFFPIQVDLSIHEKETACILAISLKFQLKGIYSLASKIIKEIVRHQAVSILKKLKHNIEDTI